MARKPTAGVQHRPVAFGSTPQGIAPAPAPLRVRPAVAARPGDDGNMTDSAPVGLTSTPPRGVKNPKTYEPGDSGVPGGIVPSPWGPGRAG